MRYQIGHIRIRIRHISWLQGHRLHVSLLAEDTLQRGNVIHQFDRAVITDVVDELGRLAGTTIGAGAVPIVIRRLRLAEQTDTPSKIS